MNYGRTAFVVESTDKVRLLDFLKNMLGTWKKGSRFYGRAEDEYSVFLSGGILETDHLTAAQAPGLIYIFSKMMIVFLSALLLSISAALL